MPREPLVSGGLQRDPQPARGEGDVTRRGFVQALGLTAAAGLAGCGRSKDLVPYGAASPEVTPGIALHYATSMVLDGYATGLLAESHVGRPTKIEGNPDHPASLGAAGPYEQASVRGLYDPARGRNVRQGELTSDLERFGEALSEDAIRRVAGERGEGLRFLLEPTSSPIVADAVARIRERYPAARFAFYSPLARDASLRAAETVLGRPLDPQFDFQAADVVLSLDADFTASMPFSLRYARHFAARRRVTSPADPMNRLYVVESSFTPTGTIADHRLALPPSGVARLAASVAAEVARARGADGLGAAVERQAEGSGATRTWARAVAADLLENRGRSIVIAGDRQPEAVHALAFALNELLGNLGRTAWYTEPALIDTRPELASLHELVEEMRAGDVRLLVVAGANPVYSAPADLAFIEALERVPLVVAQSLYLDETASLADWYVPAAHYLESWGAARAYDGTLSLAQPLIEPLWQGRSTGELLGTFAGWPERNGREQMAAFWERRFGGAEDSEIEEWVRLGLVPGTGFARLSPQTDVAAVGRLVGETDAGRPQGGSLEAVFLQDPSLYDGRFAENAWLQELPDPVTKLTWGNAALISPATAASREVKTGERVRVSREGRSLLIPVYVLPGQADGCVSLRFGYGRHVQAPTGPASIAAGTSRREMAWPSSVAGVNLARRAFGSNVFAIWTSDRPLWAGNLALEKAPLPPELAQYPAERLEPMATTQDHWTMEGRPIALGTTLDAYRRRPGFTGPYRGPLPTLYEPFPGKGRHWAMAVDLTLCTGCASCVMACQVENNVPVVGKEGVLRHREMHWLRIDRYTTGPPADPRPVMQPMLCQHCEKAPCEYVCPVNATVHGSDGLNQMVYNRCVGTRFCSNNCPYKVRRFNWINYNPAVPETQRMAMNPDVTVRARGVMEKCTFCIQRIWRAEVTARMEGRAIRPGEVVTACQQACPTQAIVFGSLATDAEVRRLLQLDRRYAVLHEEGTRPRVHYLARVWNLNPRLEGRA